MEELHSLLAARCVGASLSWCGELSRAATTGERMSAKIDDLKTRLSRANEINISVTGRKSGRTISVPVWFVLDGDQVLLLPVSGSDTQWYKNVLKNSSLQISSGDRKSVV